MGSIIKVNEYKDFGNNAIMTSDGAGVITPNATGIKNTPAFEAYRSANQAISDNTATKVQFDTEQFDADSVYDNSSNYRFTPGVGGKYLCYSTIRGGNDGSSTLNLIQAKFYKNGSAYQTGTVQNIIHFVSNPGANGSVTTAQVIDFNTTDYLEVFAQIDTTTGSPDVGQNSVFGAYKIIGA
jgi:hypothetical protein